VIKGVQKDFPLVGMGDIPQLQPLPRLGDIAGRLIVLQRSIVDSASKWR